MRAKGGVTIGRPMDCGPARTAGGGRSGHGRRKGRPARRCKGVRGRHPLGTAGGPTARTVGVEVALLYSHGAQPRPSRRGAAAPGRAALGLHAPFAAWDGPRPLVVRQTGGGGREPPAAPVAGGDQRGWSGGPRAAGWQATCPRQARLSGGVPRTRPKGGLPATCVMHHPRVTNGGATPSIAWVVHTSCPQCMMCTVYIRGGSRPVAAWEGGTCRSGVAATGSDAAKWACGRVRPSGRARPHADLWTWGTCAPPPPTTVLFVEGRARVHTYGRWGPRPCWGFTASSLPAPWRATANGMSGWVASSGRVGAMDDRPRAARWGGSGQTAE